MIHKQGAEYKDSTEIEDAVLEDEASKKKLPKTVIIIIIIAAVLLVGILVVFMMLRGGGEEEDPGASSSSDIMMDDTYWDEFEELEPMFSYTEDEKAQLRAWGYTGDEIEAAQSAETPAETLIAQSKQAQEEARATLSNPESPEYQALLNNTWLGQNSISLPAYEEGVTESQVIYNSVTLNADYDKVPAHGYNLFLKVYLNDGSYTFMECPLVRYLTLPDSGNIVVTYKTATLGNTTIIYDMTEYKVQ